MEKEKLNFINNILKNTDNHFTNNNFKNKSLKLNLDLDWINLKKDNLKLINNEVNSLLKNNSKNISSNNISKLLTKNKKLEITKIYLNLVLSTLCLRYIDILIKVKFGGFIFTSFTIFSFYQLNKYYNKFKSSELLKELSTMNNLEVNEYLESLKLKQKKNYKEAKLAEMSLNKYWKEPMAWH